MSSTTVVLVELRRGLQTFATSAGFTGSFAGMPLVSVGLPVGVWHHIAWIIAPRGTYALFVNGTHECADDFPFEPNSTKSALISGRLDLALGRGAPDWQDRVDFGYCCIAIDDLRIWISERSSTDIMSNMSSGCIIEDTRALLAVYYIFDEVSSSETVDFFAEVSQNYSPGLLPASGASYLPWCVNVDDQGELRLDTSTTTDLWSDTKIWGQFISKPRQPGVGFNYIETEMKYAASRFNDRCLFEGKLHIGRNRGDKIHTLEITDDQSIARRATHYGTQAQRNGTEDRAQSYKFHERSREL